jgi:transglutaminase-like putative cysteine protease/tetratricopeptide (TPR) repeat protein
MLKSLCLLVLLFVVQAPTTFAQALSPAKSGPSKTDFSEEAFVIEKSFRTITFENDGTSLQEDTGQIRIQSDAGVKRYGVLTFSYASGTGTQEIIYVRVRKPDGSVVETPAENIQDMPAQITRDAPFYSDLHEKQVAVKGLSVGDVLEFQVRDHTTKSLAPGQFWAEYRFTEDTIVLDERFEVRVPRDREVKVKSSRVQPAITEANGYRVYTWSQANLKRKDDADRKREDMRRARRAVRGRLPQPDVLISSFTTWEDVGRWYGGLQEERVKPTPGVASVAAQITKDAANDEAKVRALYSYVSTHFRYIGVAFGIGRYQPHNAAEVLANQYGDCKDKHTLLAALLAAVGIPAYPALVSTTREVDSEVPSPGQFDHVITVVPLAGELVWLDTTSEVGPYRYLVPPLLDKHALVIWKDKPPSLAETPATLPYPSEQTFNMDATLNDSGVLEGRANFHARGDVEFVLRASFRLMPVPQWNDLVQRFSFGWGFGGEVSEVTASSPEKTDEPFHFSYKYTRKSFGNWDGGRTTAPLPAIPLPDPGDDDSLAQEPIWLGTPVDVSLHSIVQLPREYRVIVPAAIHLKRDFAQYDSTSEFKDGKLISDRHLRTLLREVPETEHAEYKQFVKTVTDDHDALMLLEGSNAIVPNDIKTPTTPAANPFGNLRDSANPEALRLENEGREALAKNDFQGAVSSLYRAVSADPKFTRAWVILGGLLLMQNQKEAGMDAFHKAMAADPTQPAIPKALGMSLMAAKQFEDAVPVWQDYVKAHPDDVDGVADLASCFFQLRRYSEAALAYEAAANRSAHPQYLLARMASAYLHAGEREKAGTAFSKLADLNPDAPVLNDVAYEMANADLQLPLALNYAKKAVHAVEEGSQKITLPSLKMEEVRYIFTMAAYWDTLGWVQERMSNLGPAEQYLRASWRLTQDGIVAGHLCHLYRRTHQVQQAIQMCRLALRRIPIAATVSGEESAVELAAAQENLDKLTHGRATSNRAADAADMADRERTFKLPRFASGTESAEFFVLLESDGKTRTFKAKDVKFISGSEKMKNQGQRIKSINFNFPTPDGSLTHFVWRGILGCYKYTGCSFVVLDPASVQSLE